MKKHLFFLAIILLFVQCDNPGDCVKSTGPMVSKTFEHLDFSKILVHKNIALVLKQGPEIKVEVVSGENLIDDIEVGINNNMITFKDGTSCNWVRDYGQTTVYITAPNITDIYSKTEQNITSDGILAYNSLRLVSMDTEDGFDGAGTGDFIMNIQNTYLIIEGNNVSRFYLSGRTALMRAFFYSGNNTIKSEQFLADTVRVFHRGSNDMFVHPLYKIAGDIYSVGNVHAVFRPEIDSVKVHYRGRLFYD